MYIIGADAIRQRTRTILHTRDAERPRTKYGIAIDDHDEYDRAFWREAVDEREV